MTRTKVSKRSLVAVACSLLLAVGLAACGGDDDDSSSGNGNTSNETSASHGASAPVAVTIENFDYSVDPVTAGESFSVENKDDTDHTFTADDGSFDVEVGSGETVTVDALDAGSYKFHCKIHPSMTGTLEVG